MTEQPDDKEYELNRVLTRAEGAATLRRLATGVETGAVTLADETVVTVPEQFDFEIEYEQEADEAELEVELEWPVEDGVVAVRSESEDSEAVAVESESMDSDAESPTSAGDADAVDVIGLPDAESKAQFELYQDRANEWRWRLVHDNGNIIADSGEGYSRKATARKGLESVMRNAPGAAIEETVD